ncbi:MAG: single-stranded DNA-binding protein [Microbacteriaceae bacterium]|nr:single-stranded DNA-binding protein [Microbacteriaceae bacterium]
MAGELSITVVGNLANDPELRNTNSGIAFVGLNVASTPRTYNRNTSTWEDGETVWVKCTAWREVAENVARSLTKGTRVIITGRLKPASAYQSNTGEARASIEIEIEEIGPSLRYATAAVTRRARDGQQAVDSNPWNNAPAAPATPAAGSDSWANPGTEPGFASGDNSPF